MKQNIVHAWDLHGEASFRTHAAMPESVLNKWVREIRNGTAPGGLLGVGS